jgi:hypothetical protein
MNELSSYCQENKKLIDSIQISINSGVRSIACDSIAMNNYPDYVNGICNFNQSVFIDLDFSLYWNKNISSKIQWMIIDSYLFNNFNITTDFYPFKYFGVSLGYSTFDYFIENYNRFYELNYSQYDIIDDDNFFQRRASDHAIIIGPVFRFQSNNFAFNLSLYGGYIENKPFTETITLKQRNSNSIQQYKIETTAQRTNLFNPVLNVDYFFIETKKTIMGVQLKGSLLMCDKSIDYQQTIYHWTTNNSETTTVQNSKHKFIKYEFGIGFTLKW